MDAAVAHILNIRNAPGTRRALRNAASPAQEHYAYPYLASWWANDKHRRESMLATASLAATFPQLGQCDHRRVGDVAADLVRSGAVSQDWIERKLVSVQNGSLESLVGVIRSMLKIESQQRGSTGIDWNDLFWTARRWDHTNRSQRRNVRRGLLEDFYQRLHVAPDEGNSSQTPGKDPS